MKLLYYYYSSFTEVVFFLFTNMSFIYKHYKDKLYYAAILIYCKLLWCNVFITYLICLFATLADKME